MINMNLWTKPGLKGKTIFGLGALLLVALLIMGWATYYQGMTLAIDELLQSTGKNIEKDAFEVGHFVEDAKNDLMIISDAPTMKGVVRARNNSGIDPLFGVNAEFWRSRAEELFHDFLEYHHGYYKIRYIDEKGDEIVRLDRAGGIIKIIPRKELQNKARRPYFRETMKLGEDEVYYSEVNLDQEHGEVLIPHTPVLRVATPVFDAEKRRRGIVVISLSADALFSNVRTVSGETRKYVVNQDGYLLVHPDRTKEFGFDLGFEYTAKNVMHESSDEMKALDNHVKYHKQDRHIDGFKKIFFDPMNKGRYWAIIYVTPENWALKNVYLARNTMAGLSFAIIVFSLLLITWISTRKLVTPILKLSEAVKKIENGDLTARVPEDGRSDEIGELGSSINRMAGIIEKNVTDLTSINSTLRASEETIKRNLQIQHVLNSLLKVSLEGIPLKELLVKALDVILSVPFLPLMPKGGIFLVEEGPEVLILIANRGFSVPIQDICAGVPFGRCLCGRAAASRQIQFADCLDERHENRYDGITPHGHYNVPILSMGKVLGVLVLYLQEGHRQDKNEMEFLQAVVNTLAGIIERKKSEDELRKNNETLERKVEDRTAELKSVNKELESHHAELLALFEASRSILDMQGFNNIARFIFDSCKKLVGATAGYVAMLSRDETENEVLFLDTGGRPCTVDRSLPMPIRGLRETAYHTGKTVYENDFPGSNWEALMPEGHARLDNVLFAPLIVRGKAYGVLGLANKPGGFTESDSRIVSAFAELVTIAYLNDKSLVTLKYSEERFRSVVQTANVAIVNIDEYGKIIFWNKAAENIFGYSLEEALGRLVTLIIPERLRSAHLAGVERIVSTGASKIIGKTIETFGLRKDGSEFYVELSVSPWESKEGRFFTGILHDITDKKLAEKALLTAKETSDAANRAKSDFLANMSHELRTPLNSIIGFSDIMLDGIAGEMSELQKENLGYINISGKHLLTLINDILDIAKVEAGKMELELSEFGVQDLIKRCLVMFKEKALKHGIAVEYLVADSITTIKADEMKIKQVIVNLLSNAFKYTPDEGAVSVQAFDPDGNFLEISVSDTGPGIKPVDIPKLFQPFQQLETTLTAKKPGTGLGLNLCKKFVELHGGRISVESEVGKGSRFTFTIPVIQNERQVTREGE